MVAVQVRIRQMHRLQDMLKLLQVEV